MKKLFVKLVCLAVMVTVLIVPCSATISLPNQSENGVTYKNCMVQTGTVDFLLDGIGHKTITLDPAFKGKKFTVVLNIFYVSSSTGIISRYECTVDELTQDNYNMGLFDITAYIIGGKIDFKNQSISDDVSWKGGITLNWTATAES